MNKLLIVAFLVSAVGCTNQKKENAKEMESNNVSEKVIRELECPFKGTAAQWMIVYCRQKLGVKEKYSKQFRGCEMQLNDTLYEKSNCQKIEWLKKQTCELNRNLGYYSRGISTCLKDRDIESKWLGEFDAQ